MTVVYCTATKVRPGRSTPLSTKSGGGSLGMGYRLPQEQSVGEVEGPSNRGSVAAAWIAATLVLAVFMFGLWVASEWLQRR